MSDIDRLAEQCAIYARGIMEQDKKIQSLLAENERLRKENDSFRHAGDCLQAAISRIDYELGEPNEMQCSLYDVDCNEDRVVERVKKMCETLRLAIVDAALLEAERNDAAMEKERRDE